MNFSKEGLWEGRLRPTDHIGRHDRSQASFLPSTKILPPGKVRAPCTTPDVSLPSVATSCNSRSDARQGRARPATGANWVTLPASSISGSPGLVPGWRTLPATKICAPVASPGDSPPGPVPRRGESPGEGHSIPPSQVAGLASTTPAQDRGSQQRELDHSLQRAAGFRENTS